jgi:hypothetical protein
MTDRARLESLLRIPLSETMVDEAAGLARSVAEAARRAAAPLPAEARDPTGFRETLESLAPED